MGFWETAAAAFVGGVGVLVLVSLCRLGWFMFNMHFTPFGRHQTRVGMKINQVLKDAEQHERLK